MDEINLLVGAWPLKIPIGDERQSGFFFNGAVQKRELGFSELAQKRADGRACIWTRPDRPVANQPQGKPDRQGYLAGADVSASLFFNAASLGGRTADTVKPASFTTCLTSSTSHLLSFLTVKRASFDGWSTLTELVSTHGRV